MKRFALFAALTAALTLVGCAQPVKPLYQWDGYQVAVYQYLKTNGGEPGAQIAMLEAQVEKNQAGGVATPPGMRAHLALLHSKIGNDAAARTHLEAERAQFPESAAYVDFLLKRVAKNAGEHADKGAVITPAAAAASQPKS